ncbi:hypothetical protein RQP46_002397 [Phenoliferia psychrophenolica]
MAPKRKSDANDGPAAKVSKKAAAGVPAWDWKAQHPSWSATPPAGPHGKACVEKYCLLAPYDPSITEAQWEAYATERARLDEINTTNSEDSYVRYNLTCSDLSANNNLAGSTLSSCSSDLAREVMGAAMDLGEKTALSRTLRGSLYMLAISGTDDGDGSPRSVDAKLRLYGPHGLGNSVDFEYSFHHRTRMDSVEHRVYLSAFVRDISLCGVGKATDCWTTDSSGKNGREKRRDGAIAIVSCWIDSRDKHSMSGTTLAKLQDIEAVLLGRSGVMSMRKLFNTLLAAGSVRQWDEDADEDINGVQAKYKPLQAGETDGRKEVKADEAKVEDGVPEMESEGEFEAHECVPQNLLALARGE